MSGNRDITFCMILFPPTIHIQCRKSHLGHGALWKGKTNGWYGVSNHDTTSTRRQVMDTFEEVRVCSFRQLYWGCSQCMQSIKTAIAKFSTYLFAYRENPVCFDINGSPATPQSHPRTCMVSQFSYICILFSGVRGSKITIYPPGNLNVATKATSASYRRDSKRSVTPTKRYMALRTSKRTEGPMDKYRART